MIILCLRTDRPEAEIHLILGSKAPIQHSWQAHKKLAETIHQQIQNTLKQQRKTISDIEAIAVYRGPGSFTGLRIGMSVANAMSYALQVPIVGEAGGDDWLQRCQDRLRCGENDRMVTPVYGSEPYTTSQKR